MFKHSLGLKFSVAYLVSGSWIVGGAVALIEPAVNTLAYHFHEKAWERVRGNRRDPTAMAA